MANKTIIAAGGDILTDQLLQLYALAQIPEKNEPPKVCLIPTASGDDGQVINFFHKVFSQYPCRTSVLSVFHPSGFGFRDEILSSDLLLCSGGHTKSALDLWKANGIDLLLKEAYDKGIIIAGGSAGAVAWFDECLTDSFPPHLTVMPGLGFISASCCPHFSSRERRKAYKTAIAEGRIKAGYAISDHGAIHFKDGGPFRSLSSMANISNFWIRRDDKTDAGTLANRLHTLCLKEPDHQQALIFDSPLFSFLNEDQDQEENDKDQEQQNDPSSDVYEELKFSLGDPLAPLDDDAELPQIVSSI